jgi:hypothetical protein
MRTDQYAAIASTSITAPTSMVRIPEAACRKPSDWPEESINTKVRLNRGFTLALMEFQVPPIKLVAMAKKLSFSGTLSGASILFVSGAFSSLVAAGTPIGMAVANGSFLVDHSRVWGNTTLFEGSVIETATAQSEVQLNSGVTMRLASDSRATVYQNKLVLESGYGQLESAAPYEIEARSLQISTGRPGSVARIRLEGARKVTVAALGGDVRVLNAAGLLVADVEAGKSLDFEPQAAGAATPTHASGCLLEKSGKIIVVEQITNVILELQGLGLEHEIGNRVEITGAATSSPVSVPGASQLIKVAAVKEVSKGGCTSIAKKVGAATAAAGAATAVAGAAAGAGSAAGAGAAAASAGIGIGTIAVIGGVAAAATVGGLAAVGSLPGQSDSPPSASR